MHELLNWVRECNKVDRTHFVDFIIGDAVVGAVNREQLPLFSAHPEVFIVKDTGVYLHPVLDTPERRTKAVGAITREWHNQGVIPTWREEPYRVSINFSDEPLMRLERAAAGLFGIQRYGVHINGLTRRNGELMMWISRRSPHNPTFPNQYDQLVAGGIATGMTPWETLIKECGEEAAIPPELARQAKAVGTVSYAMDHHGKLIRDVLFIYDLMLPEDFTPHNQDGEVSEFYLWPVMEVIETISSTREFKLNTNLVVMDFLIRYAYLTPEDPWYTEICGGLRNTW